MNVSTIEGWETTHTTTDDNTFYSSENEPRKVYWDISSSDTFDSNEPRNVSVALEPFLHSAASTKTEKETQHKDVLFEKRGSVAAHLGGTRPIPTERKST